MVLLDYRHHYFHRVHPFQIEPSLHAHRPQISQVQKKSFKIQ